MYRDNYITALRTELLEMVSEQLTPVAMRYGYSEVPLETNIKWRPQVLVLGNYSSGKSTLINEFLGMDVQGTGQAPTDDSFTFITHDENEPDDAPVRVTDQRDGKFLLNDPEYPFETLKKHGQRFASHFKLKKVNARFLKTWPSSTHLACSTASPNGTGATTTRMSSAIWRKLPIWCWCCSIPTKPVR
jgi:EH domain-containing protein 1